MNTNKPLIAILIGVVSTIPFEIFTRIATSLGFSKYSLYQLDSIVITSNRPTALLGFMVSSTLAGLIALIFYYALEKLGTDYLVIKSVLISVLTWAALEFMLTLGFEGTKIPQRAISGYYSQFIGIFIFGTTMGLLFKRYLVRKPLKVK